MKLLYLSNLRLPTEKAYGIQIAKMCEAFAAIATTNNQQPTTNNTNVEVELVVPYRRNPIKADVFEYYSVKKIFNVKKLPAIDFYLPGPFDRIAVGIKSFISAVILVFYALVKDVDIVYSRDELILFMLSFFRKNIFFEAHRFSAKRKFFYSRFKKKGVKVIAISQAIKNDLAKAGYEPNKILVAHDGVDLELFNVNMSKENARTKLDLPTDPKIVLYSGHLFEWKGAGTLLRVAKLVSNFKEILFVFVGGTEHDVKEFRKKVEGLDNVLVLGYKLHKDIPVYLKAADVLVLPNSARDKISKYTSPLKLFEYMASERPIVASDLPSIREILNSRNAILVVPDDPGSLKEGINRVLKDGGLGRRLSQKAKEDVRGFSWAGRAEKILNFIN